MESLPVELAFHILEQACQLSGVPRVASHRVLLHTAFASKQLKETVYRFVGVAKPLTTFCNLIGPEPQETGPVFQLKRLVLGHEIVASLPSSPPQLPLKFPRAIIRDTLVNKLIEAKLISGERFGHGRLLHPSVHAQRDWTPLEKQERAHEMKEVVIFDHVLFNLSIRLDAAISDRKRQRPFSTLGRFCYVSLEDLDHPPQIDIVGTSHPEGEMRDYEVNGLETIIFDETFEFVVINLVDFGIFCAIPEVMSACFPHDQSKLRLLKTTEGMWESVLPQYLDLKNYVHLKFKSGWVTFGQLGIANW